ncbi:MAG: DUF6089 family protein [Cytophagales bacterium]
MKKSVAILFLLFSSVYAQDLEFGGGLGTMLYKGEVSPYYSYKSPGLCANLFFLHNLSHVVGIKYQAGFGIISASDNFSRQPLEKKRNYSFRNNIGEFAAMLVYNFRDYRESPKTFKVSSKWSPYFIGGLGGFVHNSLVEGGGAGSVCIPLGLGVKWITTKKWNVGIEFLARKTFTDYIDGLGRNDINLPQRAFTNDNDWYCSLTFTISHTLYEVKCPDSSPTYHHPHR